MNFVGSFLLVPERSDGKWDRPARVGGRASTECRNGWRLRLGEGGVGGDARRREVAYSSPSFSGSVSQEIETRKNQNGGFTFGRI